ncbi:endonuclease V-like protein [Dinothrombium tinctorium]|uniref:Endonuclease V-like protein n=1 Tax=Dinothrombium tinctorium TaxID=1965070 RepID=A0A3S3S6K7_9ACAR|nr:endonuclease V-like protein [Dinothrombium tinctorium]
MSVNLELRKRLILNDVDIDASKLSSIGAIDVSYSKHDLSTAVTTLVVLNDRLELIYSHSSTINDLTTPYIPGFLAFRELEYLKKEVDLLRETKSHLMPDIWLVDGNGILHRNGFGLASHFGVACDLVTIGVSKNPYIFDCSELSKRSAKNQYKILMKTLKNVGDYFYISHPIDKTILGVGLKTTLESTNPIFVSIGHKCSLNTAIAITLKCCKYRIPEPIRFADSISRRHLI